MRWGRLYLHRHLRLAGSFEDLLGAAVDLFISGTFFFPLYVAVDEFEIFRPF